MAAERELTDGEVLEMLREDERNPRDNVPRAAVTFLQRRLAAARIALRERDAVAQALNAPWYDDEELTQISKGALRRLRDERDALRERLAAVRVATLDECATQLYAICDKYADGGITVGIVCGIADKWGDEVDAAGPTPPAAASVACDCRAAVEGLLHTIRNEDRRPSESYCAALEDVVAMLTTGAAPFTCPHCGFVYYDERQRIVCNNCGEPPNKGGCDDGQ